MTINSKEELEEIDYSCTILQHKIVYLKQVNNKQKNRFGHEIRTFNNFYKFQENPEALHDYGLHTLFQKF